jgi:hypothetical protein
MMKNYVFRNLLKCNLAILFFQAIALLFLVGGIIAYYVVDKNQDDLRTNLKNLLI